MSYVVPNRQEVMSEELGQEILNVKPIGSEMYNALRQDRFMDRSKKISSIHRTTSRGLHNLEKNNVHRKANTNDGS